MRKANGAMTVEQARRRYAGNWMALEVVSRDRNRLPRKVRLIAKSRQRDALFDKIGAAPHVYVAFAGPVAPKGWAVLY